MVEDREAVHVTDRDERLVETAIVNGFGGATLAFHGEFVDLTVEPPRVGTVSGRSPLFYFGGLSPAARECAAAGADVFLMWPDTTDKMLAVKDDMDARAAAKGRSLRYGWRSHVIVRETEEEARAAASRLLSKLDVETGEQIRKRSLDSASAGVANQAALREAADEDGYVERHLWTGVGRARSGAGAAIVGDPDHCVTEILRFIAAYGITDIVTMAVPLGLRTAQMNASLERLFTDVAPRVKRALGEA